MSSKTIKIISIISAVVGFALVCVLIFQSVSISNLKKKEKSLQSNLSTIEQQIVDYTNTNNYVTNKEYLEEYAREVLNWGKGNEMVFK